ncbi:hypothetical protein [Salinisphaera orenii]|uniref:hypothetical protein n=1 Tax=Salinisphaera orenii TaxID=856731 RepID=UPI000DBE082D
MPTDDDSNASRPKRKPTSKEFWAEVHAEKARRPASERGEGKIPRIIGGLPPDDRDDWSPDEYGFPARVATPDDPPAQMRAWIPVVDGRFGDAMALGVWSEPQWEMNRWLLDELLAVKIAQQIEATGSVDAAARLATNRMDDAHLIQSGSVGQLRDSIVSHPAMTNLRGRIDWEQSFKVRPNPDWNAALGEECLQTTVAALTTPTW